jgi:hypothetical protein
MTRKALIHIGSGKTGTSSLQEALLESEKLKINKYFRYPVIEDKGHQAIEVLFKDYERVSRGLKSRFKSDNEEYREFVDNFFVALNHYAESGNILLSSEFMFSFNELEVKSLKQYLEDKGFSDFKIVVYLRAPASYYLSLENY